MGKGHTTGFDLGSQGGQCGTINLPLTRGETLVGPCVVQGQPEPKRFSIGNVIGGEHLPLDDRARHGDVLEPTGVNRGMDQHNPGIHLTQPLPRGRTARRRTVVHHPAQACAGPVRFLRQDLVNEATKGGDPCCRFTASHDISPAHIPCRQRVPGATARVCLLDLGRATWSRRQRTMTADPGLAPGLCVGAEDVVLGAKALAWPRAGIEIPNRPGLLSAVGITGKTPVRVAPRFAGIRRHNPPPRAATERFA